MEPLPGQPHPQHGQRHADIVPAHHRPPNLVYDDYGRPHHVTLAQPSQPPIIVQMPERRGLPPELERLIIITFLICAVVAVCTGAVIGIIVIAGGTLMGIIGTIGANAVPIGLTTVAIIAAVGWAASKVKSARRAK